MAGQLEHRQIESELTELLDRWMAETRDPVLEGPVPRPPSEAEVMARIRSPEGMQARRQREAELQLEYASLTRSPI